MLSYKVTQVLRQIISRTQKGMDYRWGIWETQLISNTQLVVTDLYSSNNYGFSWLLESQSLHSNDSRKRPRKRVSISTEETLWISFPCMSHCCISSYRSVYCMFYIQSCSYQVSVNWSAIYNRSHLSKLQLFESYWIRIMIFIAFCCALNGKYSFCMYWFIYPVIWTPSLVPVQALSGRRLLNTPWSRVWINDFLNSIVEMKEYTVIVDILQYN